MRRLMTLLNLRAVLLGCSLSVAAMAPTSCGSQPSCSALNCPQGCCDSSGTCQGNSSQTCGSNGNACVACAAGQSCAVGVCQGGGAGGGSTQGSAITGDVDGFPLTTAYAGLSNLWVEVVDPPPFKMVRYGSVVALSNVPNLCAAAPPTDPETWLLMFRFQDTTPGTYAVVADDLGHQFSATVQAYLRLMHNGQETLALAPVSGTVTLESISTTTTDPLTDSSTSAGSFTITFLKGSNRVLSCDGTSSGTDCMCGRKDGSTFNCHVTVSGQNDCCNDGVTQTQTITGHFQASFCTYLCTCLKSTLPCPCFQ